MAGRPRPEKKKWTRPAVHAGRSSRGCMKERARSFPLFLSFPFPALAFWRSIDPSPLLARGHQPQADGRTDGFWTRGFREED